MKLEEEPIVRIFETETKEDAIDIAIRYLNGIEMEKNHTEEDVLVYNFNDFEPITEEALSEFEVECFKEDFLSKFKGISGIVYFSVRDRIFENKISSSGNFIYSRIEDENGPNIFRYVIFSLNDNPDWSKIFDIFDLKIIKKFKVVPIEKVKTVGLAD